MVVRSQSVLWSRLRIRYAATVAIRQHCDGNRERSGVNLSCGFVWNPGNRDLRLGDSIDFRHKQGINFEEDFYRGLIRSNRSLNDRWWCFLDDARMEMVVSMTRELFPLFVLCFHRILEKVGSRVDPFFFYIFRESIFPHNGCDIFCSKFILYKYMQIYD